MIFLVTPLSRPENLEKIYNSIFDAIPINEQHNYKWVIVVDRAVAHKMNDIQRIKNKSSRIEIFQSDIRNAVVGHAHRNYFIMKYKQYFGENPNDWVYFIDDDTVFEKEFHNHVFTAIEENPNKAAIVFHQKNKDNTPRLVANLDNIKVCHIDMGQYVLNLSKIGTLRFVETDYCADGIFIENHFATHGKEGFLLVDAFCATYNALR